MPITCNIHTYISHSCNHFSSYSYIKISTVSLSKFLCARREGCLRLELKAARVRIEHACSTSTPVTHAYMRQDGMIMLFGREHFLFFSSFACGLFSISMMSTLFQCHTWLLTEKSIGMSMRFNRFKWPSDWIWKFVSLSWETSLSTCALRLVQLSVMRSTTGKKEQNLHFTGRNYFYLSKKIFLMGPFFFSFQSVKRRPTWIMWK